MSAAYVDLPCIALAHLTLLYSHCHRLVMSAAYVDLPCIALARLTLLYCSQMMLFKAKFGVVLDTAPKKTISKL